MTTAPAVGDPVDTWFDDATTAINDVTAVVTPNSWTSATWLNPGTAWTGNFDVRLVDGVPGGMQVYIHATPGTKSNGTSIATLPVGYRPLTEIDVLVSVDAIAGSSSQTPHLYVASTGNVVCYGCSAAAFVGANLLVAIDI